ncbi:BamA/TamA family outer membrane protein [Alloacidobacterium dinghuense]|uniref:BamA/TamA family outer membrane protein n=1 Tax=Alloacidobacterium dinghuense TaxID=2763107 RepID=A0A7G8BEC8_9BACT|nr:BamA/TamA family outer membrane protein [Alloacidobacterium dinghuense]QNI30898.1 BamA/TamA family outer membrane protein [Alloacidobacterium dinghuense]
MKASGDFRTLRAVILLLCMGTCLCFVNLASAGANLPTNQPSSKESQAPQDSTRQSSSTPSTETKAEEKSETNEETKKEKKKKEKKSDHAGSFVIAPLPLVSPALGAGIIPILGYITPIPAKDRGIEPSVIGAGGLITNDGSRGFGIGADLYLDKARYELESVYAHGNLEYNLYGEGFVNGNAGLKLPLEQSGQIFFIKLLRRIPWDFYVGGRFTTGSSFITLKPTSEKIPPIPPDIGLHTDLRALGMEVWRDSRPNRFYPLKGSVIDFTGDFFAQDLGSKYSFQSYKFTFNKYLSLPDKQVLAYNLYWCGTGGTPPFYGNCIYGASNELRGYTAGRYLDHYMFATQLEYRLVLPWKFGLVGFGGVGAVAPGSDQFFRANHLLPAGGTGIRYMLSKKYHVNLRTDFAWGKDNFTWGVGVGEAF